jgi:hypothetical protein
VFDGLGRLEREREVEKHTDDENKNGLLIALKNNSAICVEMVQRKKTEHTFHSSCSVYLEMCSSLFLVL